MTNWDIVHVPLEQSTLAVLPGGHAALESHMLLLQSRMLFSSTTHAGFPSKMVPFADP